MLLLTYLLYKICCEVEIYFTGLTGQRYLKTAFILCDVYTELTSKLFLMTDNPRWSDKKANGKHYKNSHTIQEDIRTVVAAKRLADLEKIRDLHAAMKARRERSNAFFTPPIFWTSARTSEAA